MLLICICRVPPFPPPALLSSCLLSSFVLPAPPVWTQRHLIEANEIMLLLLGGLGGQEKEIERKVKVGVEWIGDTRIGPDYNCHFLQTLLLSKTTNLVV